ncbi:hypothetical protein DTO166G4_3716 [Paecilomyces variotii]|uniref:Uncharacterized protein n=1 Tax=Byssochlamys spectabilis TaxID=264951 RepID=A0A443I308_BYSSP|nr:hypothetical protein C8Q69DRAFT_459047 [Paecilomyces variotii]KAJ9214660.1 hypothetical protein DTO166G4_3716 [Paecilomyces variotii]KAJ9224242.1 hypothetical protein DTO169C6_3347 [Paecilomyces variotii]KAJ9232547.1 hypothetical protein DTO166G5_6143 [Paecilomyces variotii]KAJ9267487.1 hypothetical protein DTO195F2_720 [Paecilomyces variotii]KAJ9284415.1 hypothetical protein DTO021C3_7968 [Paecilomyces variotii]
MSDRPSRPSSTYLEPPAKSVELEDPGAQEPASGSDEEHFSDASEGRLASVSRPASRAESPVPITRVEKVDDEPSYGEVPGSTAYEKRQQDAVPDEVEVLPEGQHSRRGSRVELEPDVVPSGNTVPRTLVEKVDPEAPSYGEVPGTEAYERRKADAAPDLVFRAAESGSRSNSIDASPQEQKTPPSPVPQTLLSRVDSIPTDGTTSAPHAHRRRPSDALPDATETVEDAPEDEEPPHGDNDDASMNDFDEFEEGEAAADDDFGDFDDGFQESLVEAVEEESTAPLTPQLPPASPFVPPLLDFDSFTSLSDLAAATDSHLDILFPNAKSITNLPPVDPIPDSSAIFTSERSLSLWSQLVAPPPLQPPNWVKSRIRRLFLVSLGVPVDLDEILPASKQKKLVLPSIDLDGSKMADASQNLQQKKDGQADGSSTSANASDSAKQRSTRRRGPPPPPELDLSAVHRLCATTDAALDGFTDAELKTHVKELKDTTNRASQVLEYWLKLRDGLVSEKEAFEGVIENLVSHARRVRK